MNAFIQGKTALILASTAIISGFVFAQPSLGDTTTRQITTTTTDGQTINKTSVTQAPMTPGTRTQ